MISTFRAFATSVRELKRFRLYRQSFSNNEFIELISQISDSEFTNSLTNNYYHFFFNSQTEKKPVL